MRFRADIHAPKAAPWRDPGCPRPVPARAKTPGFSTMNALTISPRKASGLPTAAAGDGGMAQQAVLDLGRPDAIARRWKSRRRRGPRRRHSRRRRAAPRSPVSSQSSLNFCSVAAGRAPIGQEHHRVGPPNRDLAGLAVVADRAVGGGSPPTSWPGTGLPIAPGAAHAHRPLEASTRLHSVWP